MNLLEAFVEYLENLGIATRGQDLWISEVPSSQQLNNVDNQWWVIASGGQPLTKTSTGEMMKIYQFQVFNRNRNIKQIQNAMFSLEESLNCDGCTQLTGYDTIDIEASTFPIDQDIDNEDRKVGLLQVNITTYKEC